MTNTNINLERTYKRKDRDDIRYDRKRDKNRDKYLRNRDRKRKQFEREVE